MPPSDGLPDTLAGRAYLAMYDRDRGRLTSRRWAGQLLGAAAVTDLYLGGYLADDRGLAKAAAGRDAPGNAVLAEVWRRVTAGRPRRWQHWVHQRKIEELVRADLTGRWIQVERPAGFLRRARVSPRDPRSLTRLHGLVTSALRGPMPVDRLPGRDTALVALLAVADVRTVISRNRRREHARRIDQMIEHTGPPAVALRRAINQARHMQAGGG